MLRDWSRSRAIATVWDAEQRPRILRDVYRVKRQYLELSGVPVGDGFCSVLTCNASMPTAQERFVLNSMEYCIKHSGLALFNGLRHGTQTVCQACLIWNVMCLKQTGNPTDHGHYMNCVNNIGVPLREKAVGCEPRVCVKSFMTPEYNYLLRSGVVNIGQHELLYYDLSGTPLPVPYHAFVFLEGKPPVVTAWIKVEQEHCADGTMKPVTDISVLNDITRALPQGDPLSRRLQDNGREFYSWKEYQSMETVIQKELQWYEKEKQKAFQTYYDRLYNILQELSSVIMSCVYKPHGSM